MMLANFIIRYTSARNMTASSGQSVFCKKIEIE